MYKGKRIIAVIPAYNEGRKIGDVIRKMPRDIVDTVLLVDDCSTDDTPEIGGDSGAEVIRMAVNSGVGAALRAGMEHSRKRGFDIIVVAAGNGKDDPAEIERLLGPIAEEGYDFIQGSRYLESGRFGHMPLYRIYATKIVHPLLFSMLVRKKLTDTTNGFRAFKASILDDPRIDLSQKWLDRYELEPYLYYKAITLGYKTGERPVSKVYPPKSLGYTKMRPVTGWWSILRPIFLLALKIKK